MMKTKQRWDPFTGCRRPTGCVSVCAYSSNFTDLCLRCSTFPVLLYNLGAKSRLGKAETCGWKWPQMSVNVGKRTVQSLSRMSHRTGIQQRKNRNSLPSNRLFTPLNINRFYICFLLLRSHHCHDLLRSQWFFPHRNEKTSTDHIRGKTSSSDNAKTTRWVERMGGDEAYEKYCVTHW